MKALALILLVLLSSVPGLATERPNDLILIGKDTVFINSYPLERLQMHFGPFGRIAHKPSYYGSRTGYHAVWRVENDSLFLEDIYSSAEPERKEDIAELFRKNRLESKFLNGRVYADWYDCDLEIELYIGGRDDNIYLHEDWYKLTTQGSPILKFTNGVLVVNRLAEYPELARKMNLEAEKRIERGARHYSLSGGAWVPTGNLSLVGSHPYLGLQFGIRLGQLVTNLSANLKFLKSSNQFLVRHEDSTYLSNRFFGSYLGLDLIHPIAKIGKHQLDLLGGFGWDGLDVLRIDKPGEDEDITKSLNSLNLNGGLGYKFIYRKRRYVGVDVKYNYVNYKNHGGTDLSGYPLIIGVVFGFWE